mgnify:CR=1 FL=1
MTSRLILCLIFLFTFGASVAMVACSTPANNGESAVESGGTTDASTADTASGSDTASTQDTGTTPDTGSTPDAGNTQDTGTTQDTGSSPETGTTQDTGGTTETPSTPEPTPEPAPQKKFADMDYNDKFDYMKTVVMPAMKKLFKAYDASLYSDIKCSICHGSNAKSNKYKMPNGIEPLDPRKMPNGDGAKFMKEKVVPTMIKLLGATPFDPKTGKGFGCFACHGRK